MRLNEISMVVQSAKTTGKKRVGNNVASIGTALKDIGIISYKGTVSTYS